MTANEFRKMALSPPETTEGAHMHHPDLIQGYGKVGYEVADIERVVRIMKADNVRFVYDLRESSGKEFAQYRNCIVLDNNGNWVQLYQKK